MAGSFKVGGREPEVPLGDVILGDGDPGSLAQCHMRPREPNIRALLIATGNGHMEEGGDANHSNKCAIGGIRHGRIREGKVVERMATLAIGLLDGIRAVKLGIPKKQLLQTRVNRCHYEVTAAKNTGFAPSENELWVHLIGEWSQMVERLNPFCTRCCMQWTLA